MNVYPLDYLAVLAAVAFAFYGIGGMVRQRNPNASTLAGDVQAALWIIIILLVLYFSRGEIARTLMGL